MLSYAGEENEGREKNVIQGRIKQLCEDGINLEGMNSLMKREEPMKWEDEW